MNSKFTLLFALLFCFQIQSQETKKQFPNDFVGIYKGELKYETPNGIATIPMEFHLKKQTRPKPTIIGWSMMGNQGNTV